MGFIEQYRLANTKPQSEYPSMQRLELSPAHWPRISKADSNPMAGLFIASNQCKQTLGSSEGPMASIAKCNLEHPRKPN